MNKSCLVAGILCAFVAVDGNITPASAQSVDYGSLEELFGEPITTSATGTPQKASETPANMTIITADEIRQSGSRQIPEILSRVPGLDILQSGLNSFDVGVRGYQQPFQPRLLVLVDGRQVFLDDYSRTAWDNIPVNVDDIRQIEIVKGASSALFGSNAAGGVINIVTYSPVYDNNNVVAVSMGTQNQMTGDATTTIKGDWGGSKFSVGGLSADEFNSGVNTYAGGDQPAARPQHRYATNSSVIQVNPNLQGFGEFTLSDSTSNAADAPDDGVIGTQKVATYSVRGGVNWQTPFGLITSNNYLNHSLINLTETTDGGSPYIFKTDLIDSQLQDQFKLGADHTFRVGLEYKYKTFAMSGAQLVESESPALAESNYAVSGTWLWNINDKWALTNAGRLDHVDMSETGTLLTDGVNNYSNYSHSINSWSANSDLVFKATDLDSFRLGYGRGVQLPSLINSGYGLIQNFGGTIADWEGNPELKPTIVQDYSLDYTRKVPEVYSSVKIGPFYEINQDIVSPLQQYPNNITVNGQSIAFGQSLNVGNSSAYGGEVQFKGNNPSGYRWDASYSFSRVTDSNATVIQYLDYQGSAPQHHFRLLLGYTTGKWEFDGSGQYVSSTDMLRSVNGGVNEGPMATGPYSTFAGRIGYQINDRFTAAISGQNLNRGVLAASPYPAVERQGLLTLTGKF
jgi:iron complex outermembrane receptor protein